jgi:hypothetical protein
MKIYLKQVIGHKHTLGDIKAFLKGRKPGLFLILFNFLLLDPDPHSRYGYESGTRTVISMRIHAVPDPQHCPKPVYYLCV